MITKRIDDMNKVKFVKAKDGTVEITMDNETVHVFTSSQEVADFCSQYPYGTDLFGNAYASSSMDFASEYGFQTDNGAWEMLEAGLEAA